MKKNKNEDLMSNIIPILPEHLIVWFVKNKININNYAITHMYNLKNKNPEYKTLVSRIKANFNGVFYSSDCIDEATFNLMFVDVIDYDNINKLYVPTKRFDFYIEECMEKLNPETELLLDKLIKEISEMGD